MIGFIGAGNMAGAIINGCLENSVLSPFQISAFDKNRCKSERFGTITVYNNIAELVTNEDIIFLSVKPQNFEEVLKEVKDALSENDFNNKTFITIAAGISVDFIKERTNINANIIRVMPNTLMLVKKGICAIYFPESINTDVKNLVLKIFNCLGEVREYDESYMNSIISLTSSSPAYLFLLADAMAKSAASEGFDINDSVYLAACVFEGAAKMLKESQLSPEELIKMVASPGGTTLAALQVFYDNGFVETVDKAMKACTNRAEELSK